jgi:hypothetical protein
MLRNLRRGTSDLLNSQFIRYSDCPETGLQLPLFPRRLQFPIPVGPNLLLTPTREAETSNPLDT